MRGTLIPMPTDSGIRRLAHSTQPAGLSTCWHFFPQVEYTTVFDSTTTVKLRWNSVLR